MFSIKCFPVNTCIYYMEQKGKITERLWINFLQIDFVCTVWCVNFISCSDSVSFCCSVSWSHTLVFITKAHKQPLILLSVTKYPCSLLILHLWSKKCIFWRFQQLWGNVTILHLWAQQGQFTRSGVWGQGSYFAVQYLVKSTEQILFYQLHKTLKLRTEVLPPQTGLSELLLLLPQV